MANKKPMATTKKPSSPRSFKLTKLQVLLIATGLIVLVLVVWGVVSLNRHNRAVYLQQQKSIQEQQQRFDKIRQLQQEFQANVRQSLGTSLTGMIERDSCYNEGQSDFNNGYLVCGMEIQGATNELPGSASAGKGGWNTALQVAAAAKEALRQSGASYSQYTFGTKHGPDLEGHIGYDDAYTVFSPVVNCQLSVQTQREPMNINGLSVKSGQLYFTFNCEQPASEKFFQYDNS